MNLQAQCSNPYFDQFCWYLIYTYAIYTIQKFRQLDMPLIVILTHTAHEPDHSNDCGPLPKMAGHPWYSLLHSN